jgi:organic radical activating enzyme
MIHQEQKRFGRFDQDGIVLDYNSFKVNPNIKRDIDRLFEWFDKNIENLHKLSIFGGEPFLQVETERMIQFLEKRSLPDLTLIFFSNLNVDHERVKKWIIRLNKLVKEERLDRLVIVGSCDAWGAAGEYVRSGLDLKLFEKNFEYILNETQIQQQINSALTVTSVPGMVEMVEKINQWSKIKPVYWSFLKAADRNTNTGYLYPGIFGNKINSLGLTEVVEKFDTHTNGYPDSVKVAHKKYMQGHIIEFENAEPDLYRQKQLKTYLNLLDKRRGTDYKKVFPEISGWLEDL